MSFMEDLGNPLDDPNAPKRKPLTNVANAGGVLSPLGGGIPGPAPTTPAGTLSASALGGAPGGAPPPPAPANPAGTLSALGGGPPPPAAPAATAPPPVAPATPAAPTAATPAAGMDPAAAQKQLMDQFSAKFGGRQMSPAEQTEMQKRIGYIAGQPITPEMMAKGAELISQYSGKLEDYGPNATPAATPTAPTPATTTNNLAQETLQNLLKQGDTFDPNNPAATAQRASFDRVNSRETGRARIAAAERRAASGQLGSGGFDADIAGAEQAQGDRASGFESQLVTQELSAQRQKVQQALALAVQSGDQNAARQLQEKLGTLDLDLRGKLGKGQLGLGLLNSMLGDKQSGNALGLGYAQLGQQGNTDLMRILAGM